jgi:DNA-directed RNA polymerase sigma subunit (sigma70/sigma32)
MKKCLQRCIELNVSCPNSDCRMWIDYEKDLNCCLQTVEKNGELTLREASQRLGISFVRVKQLEDQAIKKMVKRNKRNKK